MKLTKIMYDRDVIGRFACDGKRYTKLQYQMFLAKRAAKRTLGGAATLLACMWLVVLGGYWFKGTVEPRVVYGKEIVEVPIKEVPPIMKRIAKCESGGSHTRNGQVVINATQDIGLYQINVPVWGKKAAEMGLNLAIEKDNEIMAMHIYENFGTEPWSASRKCWLK